jgi:type III pantothenate kinase
VTEPAISAAADAIREAVIKMLFACTIENADIMIGVFDGDQMIFDAKLATSLDKSVDEYALLISSIFSMHQVALSSIDGAIVASVVRPLNSTINQVIDKLMHVKSMVLSPGLKTGLNIKTDIPSQVGADIVANAVAAVSLAKYPLVLIDFGTATTLTCISEKGDLCGVLICPGVQTSLNALTA